MHPSTSKSLPDVGTQSASSNILRLTYRASAVLGLATLLCGSAVYGQAARGNLALDNLDKLRSTFAAPPDDARPMMRWWWFGPAVVKPELARELDAMHKAGIGGVELAAEYPLALDDPQKGLHNLRYGSPEYVEMVRFAADHARSLGMRVDLTLGSGWPFGGPDVPLELAAGRLKIVAVPLPSPASALPKLAPGDSFIAAFVASGTAEHYDAESARGIPGSTLPRALAGAAGAGPHVELFFIASHTKQQVKRAASGGEGFVLDHMARPAIDNYLQKVGNPLLRGFPDKPPYAIFSDSLEVYGSDWTPSLPVEFQRRRGYDLVAHLPELAQGGTPQADSVRYDWGITLSELVQDNYLRVVAKYAEAHGTRFRSQTYGEPAVTLADERLPQLPEGEGPQWRAFSYTRWASSANHLYGNNVTSAETWTWLHSPAFRATPLDMKAEADRMFLQGVNQIVGHGFPYSAPGVQEPGWSLYAAAALNDHNPWWPVMPAVTSYLQRVSWALRQGQPANDVAILLPEADAQAAFRPGQVTVTGEMPGLVTPELMAAVLDGGYNLDYVDVEAATARGLHYPIVIVPPTERMTLAGVRALAAYAAGGGKLVFIGKTPHRAPGLADAADSPAVEHGVRDLLAKSVHVEAPADLSSALPRLLAPDIALGEGAGKLGFLHRHSQDADIYFIANTSPMPVAWLVKVRTAGTHAEWWNADTGAATTAEIGAKVVLPPYGSRLLVLFEGARNASRQEPLRTASAEHPAIPLSNWTMAFPGSAGSPAAAEEKNTATALWSELPGKKFYSGEVRYATNFRADRLHTDEHVMLRFADGKPLPDTQAPGKPGTRAWFEAPIREAALIAVNGKEVGALWHPPYEVDVTSALKEGTNSIELRVFNTAINELAGQTPRDYVALKAKYGDRFQMQDMDNLQPVPSGIAGPVRLEFHHTLAGNQ